MQKNIDKLKEEIKNFSNTIECKATGNSQSVLSMLISEFHAKKKLVVIGNFPGEGNYTNDILDSISKAKKECKKFKKSSLHIRTLGNNIEICISFTETLDDVYNRVKFYFESKKIEIYNKIKSAQKLIEELNKN